MAEARRQIESAHLAGAEQEALRREVLDFIGVHPDCLHRSCPPGHLTGSAVIVDPATEQVLLIHHAKIGRWLQPGGHADGEANLGAVAWTEATEETGLTGLVLVTPAIDIDIHPIAARPGEPEHRHLDLRFLVLVGAQHDPAPNHETLGARWVDAADWAVTESPELQRAVLRAIEVARQVAEPASGNPSGSGCPSGCRCS